LNKSESIKNLNTLYKYDKKLLHNDVTPKVAFLDQTTPPVKLGQVSPDPTTHPRTVTSFIVHEIGMSVSMENTSKSSFKILQQILCGMRNRIC